MGNSFRENLREELDYQDMTVKDLSAKTGIPKPTLDCYLSNRNTIPPADIAVKIALVLNVTVEKLVLGNTATNKKETSIDEDANYKKLIHNLKKLPVSFQNMIETMVCATAKNSGKDYGDGGVMTEISSNTKKPLRQNELTERI